jgi:hypothetical protein
MSQVTSKTAKDIDQEEDIVSLLESEVWETTIKILFKENLRNAKDALLNNSGLPETSRVGYIMYRQKTLDALKSLYRKHNIQPLQWFED